MTEANLLEPALQYGFGGLCLILLGIVFYQIKSSERLNREMMAVVRHNTEAFIKLRELIKEGK